MDEMGAKVLVFDNYLSLAKWFSNIIVLHGMKTKTRISDVNVPFCSVTKKGKLAPRAKKWYFVGYPSGVKGYRIWCPENSKCIISKDVKFYELELYKPVNNAANKGSHQIEDERIDLEVEKDEENRRTFLEQQQIQQDRTERFDLEVEKIADKRRMFLTSAIEKVKDQQKSRTFLTSEHQQAQ
uniref:Uncharacterized protein LOC105851557 n=1 Tax=Cicer arietinum TaxID=3827 RepID=A0A1S3DY51_CICAR|nr:uncharacterized protein LOC105851557 [Cicer arietinum]